MIQEAERWEDFAKEAASLAEGVTELGILVLELFKNAAAALLGPEGEVARAAIQAATQGARAYQAIHQKVVSMLARWAPTGDDLHHLVNLQRTASEYATIADHGRRIAEHALALGGETERQLSLASDRAVATMVSLVRQVYVLLRGCLILITTGDRPLAQRLTAEEAELDRLSALLIADLDQAITAYPQRALPFHRLLFVLAECRAIGAGVAAISHDWYLAPHQLTGR